MNSQKLLIAVACIAFASPVLAAEVHMDLERYEALMKAAREGANGPQVSWGAGTVSVNLPDSDDPQFATVSVESRIAAAGDGGVEVVLLPGDTILKNVFVNGSNVTIRQRNGAHVAMIPNLTSTGASIRLTYQVAVRKSGAGRAADQYQQG